MSLHDNNVNTQSTQQTESFQEQLTKRAQQRTFQENTTGQVNNQASPKPSSRFNPFDGRIFGTPISRNRGSTSIKIFIEKLTEICETAESWITINILPLDREGRSLAFGGVVVVGRDSTNPNETAFFHTFIIEEAGDVLRPRNFTANTLNGNLDYEVIFTTPQAWDSEYVSAATELVIQRVGVKNAYQVDATVIPRSFDFHNPDNKDAIYNLAVNALAAVGNEILMSQPNWKDFSIKEFTANSQYSININFNNSNAVYDIVGNPIKNDITMEYNLSRKFQQQTNNGYVSLNRTENEAKGGIITGYMDLVWSYEGNSFGMINNAGFFGNNVPIPPLYTPNFVITSLRPESNLTPASILFALVNAMAIDRDQIWKQYFKPTNKEGHDLRDIGCLGYELIPHLSAFNQSIDERLLQSGNNYIDFKSDKVPIEAVYTMLQYAMNSRIFISLDIPEAAPDTWMLSMFYHASEGRESATNAIISAANDLTEGRFSQNFPSGAPIFYNRGNRVHTGYYLDSDGNKEDIRDITYLAVLGMSKGDINEIRNYSDTYNRTDFDINLRLSARKKIISRCTGDNAVITGYANRVTFSNEFLAALTKACSDAGYVPRLQTTASPISVGNHRATPSYLNGVLLNQNYLNTAYGGYGQQTNLGSQWYQPQPSRHF